MGDPKKEKGAAKLVNLIWTNISCCQLLFLFRSLPALSCYCHRCHRHCHCIPVGAKKNWQGPCMMWMRPTHVNPKRCGLFVLAGTKRAQNVSFVFVVAPARIMHWFLASLCATRCCCCCFCPWKREVRQKPSTGVRPIVCLPFFPLLCTFIPFFQHAVLSLCCRSCKGEARRYIQSLCFALCLPFPLPVLLRRIVFM